ncbi:hypothetical protein JL722_7907 [Aureococcus anophagefferens]|nr:hypothetical protein JL722_7907 [Aureococcus anophagefferens]
MCGAGTYFHANGDRYEGQFDDNAPDGHGSYYDAASGQRTDGTWDDGKLSGPTRRGPGRVRLRRRLRPAPRQRLVGRGRRHLRRGGGGGPGTRRPAGLCRMPCRTAGGGDLNIATEYVHAAHVVHVDFVDQKHEPEVPRDFMVVYDIVAAYGRRVAPERRRAKTRESQAERDDDSGDDDLETAAASPLEARIDFMRFLANMTRRRHAPAALGVLIESRSAKTIYPPVDDGEEREKVDATLLEPPLKWGDGDDEPEYKTLEEALRSVDAVLAEVSAEVLAQDEEEQARSRRRARDDDEPEALDELLAQVCARTASPTTISRTSARSSGTRT